MTEKRVTPGPFISRTAEEWDALSAEQPDDEEANLTEVTAPAKALLEATEQDGDTAA